MVWILVPQHPSLGSVKYYFTTPGIYKIGRKDCTVVIQTDRTVSRLHAEIKIDIAQSRDCTNFSRPQIILKDLSKFGSFVNRSASSKPVFSLPNKETQLSEGDLLTFGTDSSSFRLEHLSILPHIAPLSDGSKKNSICSAITSIGGCVIDQWCAECTHLIVEDGIYATDVILQVVAERKPVVDTTWIEAIVARTSVSSDFPDCKEFTPNLLWKINGDYTLLKITEPETRGSTFKGFLLYVGSTYLYDCRDVLESLIEASGGMLSSITSISRSRLSQSSEHVNELFIIPTLGAQLQRWMSPDEVRATSHIRRISEEKFIAAVLSGHIKDEYYDVDASSVLSASSDETVELPHPDDHENEVDSCAQITGLTSSTGTGVGANLEGHLRSSASVIRSDFNDELKAASPVESLPTSIEKFKGVQKPAMSVSSCPDDYLEKVNVSKPDIEYKKDIIVRRYVQSEVPDSTVTNFKKFRKKHMKSGNSFSTLVPFSRDPYRESDFNKELQEYMQQEKKRKQSEALAEDLFNAEQLKRRKGLGISIRLLFNFASKPCTLSGTDYEFVLSNWIRGNLCLSR